MASTAATAATQTAPSDAGRLLDVIVKYVQSAPEREAASKDHRTLNNFLKSNPGRRADKADAWDKAIARLSQAEAQADAMKSEFSALLGGIIDRETRKAFDSQAGLLRQAVLDLVDRYKRMEHKLSSISTAAAAGSGAGMTAGTEEEGEDVKPSVALLALAASASAQPASTSAASFSTPAPPPPPPPPPPPHVPTGAAPGAASTAPAASSSTSTAAPSGVLPPLEPRDDLTPLFTPPDPTSLNPTPLDLDMNHLAALPPLRADFLTLLQHAHKTDTKLDGLEAQCAEVWGLAQLALWEAARMKVAVRVVVREVLRAEGVELGSGSGSDARGAQAMQTDG